MQPHYVKFDLSNLAEQLTKKLGKPYDVGYDGGGGTYRILVWNADEENKCFEKAIAFASCMWLLVHYNSDDPRAWSFSKANSCKGVTSYGETLTLEQATDAFKKLL